MKIAHFKVEDWFNEFEKLSKYDMADTCVESLSLEELFSITGNKDKHLKHILKQKLNYGDIQGSEYLKTGITKLYNNTISTKNITITHGAIGANQLVMLATIEKGDKVVSIIPTYQQHYSIPESIGANVEKIFLQEKNNWLPNIEELKLKAQGAKIICMNNPNNPTGAVMPDSMLKEIVQIARENNSYILCDEVYRGLEHGGNISKSIIELYEKGISTGSMSKVYSLAGLRLGWIATNDEILNDIIIQREYNTISVSTIDDYFAGLALENSEKIIKRNITKILDGKKIVSDWIQQEPHISWIEPQGGTTALLKYDLEMSSVELCKKLLNDTGILFLPASAIDAEGYLRIGYCSNVKTLQEGLSKFSNWLKQF